MPAHPLDPDDTTSTVLSLRLPSQVAARIRAEAKRAGVSLSAYARRLFDAKPAGKPDVSTHQAEAKARPEPARKSDASKIEALTKQLAASEALHREAVAERNRLQKLVDQRGVFTEKQFRELQMYAHPDNSASEGLRNRIIQIINENRDVLVKPTPPPRPAHARDIPQTAEDLRRRGAAAAAERSAKAKERAAERNAKKQAGGA